MSVCLKEMRQNVTLIYHKHQRRLLRFKETCEVFSAKLVWQKNWYLQLKTQLVIMLRRQICIFLNWVILLIIMMSSYDDMFHINSLVKITKILFFS